MLWKTNEYPAQINLIEDIKNICQFLILSFQSLIHSFLYTDLQKNVMISYIKTTSPHINRANSIYSL